MKKNVFLIAILIILLAAAACNPAQSSEKSKEPPASAAQVSPVKSQNSSTPAVSETQSKQTSSIIEPSALISKAEAESILGTEVAEGKNKEQKAVGQKLCFYDAKDKGFLEVGLTQQAFMKNDMTPESIYKGIIKAFPDAKKVDGVGDEAYICTPGIHIMKSGYYITVSLGNTKDKGNIEKLQNAGKIASANLEKALKQ